MPKKQSPPPLLTLKTTLKRSHPPLSHSLFVEPSPPPLLQKTLPLMKMKNSFNGVIGQRPIGVKTLQLEKLGESNIGTMTGVKTLQLEKLGESNIGTIVGATTLQLDNLGERLRMNGVTPFKRMTAQPLVIGTGRPSAR